MATQDIKEITRKIGKNIRRYRQKTGLTQRAIAKKSGLCKSQVFHYEAGDCQPSISLLMRLAKALGTTTDELLDGVFDE